MDDLVHHIDPSCLIPLDSIKDVSRRFYISLSNVQITRFFISLRIEHILHLIFFLVGYIAFNYLYSLLILIDCR
ncbi:hypothetical protein EUGRSUZ_E01533 [Eucalyptus grandis]|uniref:Uncharacterized protein n=2 Tax=Eucalyptus grandis TaxID=71139 RepID=A0ACC3KVP3_EUCGR|nr:hypothetical protein EUGRSUZ_E01533 [Eucalyptus grandis]